MYEGSDVKDCVVYRRKASGVNDVCCDRSLASKVSRVKQKFGMERVWCRMGLV